MLCSPQQLHRDSCWRLRCFGLLGLDINIFFLVSWVSFWFLCLLKVTSAKTCWICPMWNRTGEKPLSFAELQAGRKTGLSAVCSSVRAGAPWWAGRVSAQSAAMCLHCIVRVPLRSRTKSFSPWAAHVAQCNLKAFVTDNLHRVLRAFVSFPTVLQIYNNATFRGQGYYKELALLPLKRTLTLEKFPCPSFCKAETGTQLFADEHLLH